MLSGHAVRWCFTKLLLTSWWFLCVTYREQVWDKHSLTVCYFICQYITRSCISELHHNNTLNILQYHCGNVRCTYRIVNNWTALYSIFFFMSYLFSPSLSKKYLACQMDPCCRQCPLSMLYTQCGEGTYKAEQHCFASQARYGKWCHHGNNKQLCKCTFSPYCAASLHCAGTTFTNAKYMCA